MSDNDSAITAAIEGPPSPLLAGRRQSLSPTEPAARLDQLTHAFGGATASSAPIPALTQQNDNQTEARSWGTTLFGHFDWTAGVHKKTPDVEAIYEKTSEDNPMRYKRNKARRVSLITSDGSVFNFDVPASDRGAAAPAAQMTPEDASRFIQVGGASGAGQPMLQDPAELRQEAVAAQIEVAPMVVVARRGSLADIVAQENIKATESAGKLPVILEVPPETTVTQEEPGKRKKKSSVFDSWFFRNPDYKEEDETSPAASRKPSTVVEPEIGDGKLTKKVILALGLTKDTSRKEARDLNVWMPQPGY